MIFWVSCKLLFFCPCPGNQVLRVKLTLNVWDHERVGLCVQSRVVVIVSSKASSQGASSGKSVPEEERKLYQGLEKVTRSSLV